MKKFTIIGFLLCCILVWWGKQLLAEDKTPISGSLTQTVKQGPKGTDAWLVGGSVAVTNPINISISNATVSIDITYATNGTQKTQIVSANGTNLGTATNPIRIDPTGTTAQPVSQSGTWVLATLSNIVNSVGVTGTVSITQGGPLQVAATNSLTIGNFPADQLIHGPVAVTNTPNIILLGGNLAVTNTVATSASQSGAWTNAVTQGGAFQIAVSNLVLASASQSGTWAINTVSNIIGPIGISNTINSLILGGSIAVTNTPSVAQSGTWNINTLAGGNVAITNTVATLASQSGAWTNAVTQGGAFQIGVTNSITIGNFPADQLVHGPVAITNTPNAIILGGNVAVTNTVAISGSITANNASVSSNGFAIPLLSTLVGGSVLSNNPAYLTGNLNQLSLTTNGALRGEVSSWFGSLAPTVGQKTSASSLPIVIASDQSAIPVSGSFVISTISNIVNAVGVTQAAAWQVAITNFPATQVVSGQIAVSNLVLTSTSQAGTWTINSISNLLGPIGVSNTINSLILGGNIAITNTPSVAQSGTWNIGTLTTISNVVGTISLPTGAATDATLAKLNVAQAAALGANTGPMVQGSVSTNPPVYGASTIDPLSLTTNGALRTDNTSWLGSAAPTVGQKTSANSIPMVLASDQGTITIGGQISVTNTVSTLASQSGGWQIAITNTPSVSQSGTWAINTLSNLIGPIGISNTVNSILLGGSVAVTNIPSVSQSGTWNIGTLTTLSNIVGTISLPTGAATSAFQSTGNVSLASIDSKTPPLGQTNMAASSPVTIASNQSAVPVSESGTWTLNSLSNLIGPVGISNTVNVAQSGTWNVGTLVTLSNLVGSIGVTGVVNSAQSGTWNISNIVGTISLPTGASTEATLSNLFAAYTNRTTVLGANSVTNSIPINIATNQLPFQDISVSGNLSATNAAVTIGSGGFNTTHVQILGNWVGTVNFEQSLDGTNWNPVLGFRTDDGTFLRGTSTTTNGVYLLLGAGVPELRTRMNPYTSGTATNLIDNSVGLRAVAAISTSANNFNVTATLGSSTNKTLTMKTGTLTSSSTTADQVVLTYTVTAGKTFYVEYVEVYARTTTVPGNNNVPVDYGTASLETPSGTKVISCDLAQGSTFGSARVIIPFAEPLPIAPGTVIRVVTTPAVLTSFFWEANFGGYEK